MTTEVTPASAPPAIDAVPAVEQQQQVQQPPHEQEPASTQTATVPPAIAESYYFPCQSESGRFLHNAFPMLYGPSSIPLGESLATIQMLFQSFRPDINNTIHDLRRWVNSKEFQDQLQSEPQLKVKLAALINDPNEVQRIMNDGFFTQPFFTSNAPGPAALSAPFHRADSNSPNTIPLLTSLQSTSTETSSATTIPQIYPSTDLMAQNPHFAHTSFYPPIAQLPMAPAQEVTKRVSKKRRRTASGTFSNVETASIQFEFMGENWLFAERPRTGFFVSRSGCDIRWQLYIEPGKAQCRMRLLYNDDDKKERKDVSIEQNKTALQFLHVGIFVLLNVPTNVTKEELIKWIVDNRSDVVDRHTCQAITSGDLGGNSCVFCQEMIKKNPEAYNRWASVNIAEVVQHKAEEWKRIKSSRALSVTQPEEGSSGQVLASSVGFPVGAVAVPQPLAASPQTTVPNGDHVAPGGMVGEVKQE